MKDVLETCRIVPEDWLGPMDLTRHFDPSHPIEIDLGCGKGRFLLARAAAHPRIGFLGIDRMLRRIRKVDRKARSGGLSNVRLLRVEGYYAVTYLIPPDSIDTYYVFFPDPWPKKRHHEHRLFNVAFMDAAFRTLRAGGALHMATDHLPYYEEVRELLLADARFESIDPFVPTEEEQTDFERYYVRHGEIGRISVRKRSVG